MRKAARRLRAGGRGRRLRACKLAQMTTIPGHPAAAMPMSRRRPRPAENIQRTDLNPFEQAQGLRDILVLWDCTQAEAAAAGHGAAHTGQQAAPAAARGDQRQFVLDNNLTERRAGRAAPAGEPPRRGAHQRTSGGSTRPVRPIGTSNSLLNSTAKRAHRALHGPGCAHLCEHHRPCHPAG